MAVTEEQPRERALDAPQAKIWRYIDLQRLVSLLTRRALYFARPSSFTDPYEGWMPRSHIDAMAAIHRSYVERFREARRQLDSRIPDALLGRYNADMDAALARLAERLANAPFETVQKFGVSCWHKSEYESEAMWRTYAAESVALESTVGQLFSANRSGTPLTLDNVRYMDFNDDPIERGHEHYLLYIKRKSFEHEKELRAAALLGAGAEGAFLDFDLDVLITKVHVSPRASELFSHTVSDILRGNVKPLDKPLVRSSLYDKPD
jgi:hypothetical protein